MTTETAKIQSALSYDKESGLFAWRVDLTRASGIFRRAGDKAGCLLASGYVSIGFEGKSLKAHRLAFVLVTGAWPVGVVDHIDGNKSNNRWGNLRDVARQVNAQNQLRAHRSNRTSGLIGASFHGKSGRWAASISINSKSRHLGLFDTAQAAHEAYLTSKRAIHEGSTL